MPLGDGADAVIIRGLAEEVHGDAVVDGDAAPRVDDKEPDYVPPAGGGGGEPVRALRVDELPQELPLCDGVGAAVHHQHRAQDPLHRVVAGESAKVSNVRIIRHEKGIKPELFQLVTQ